MMLLAASALVLSLLQQIEEAAHAEPPIFQVETLLQTAALVQRAERAALVASAVRANAAVRDERSRFTFQRNAAWLLMNSDAAGAARLCAEISGDLAVQCWERVDVMQAVRVLSYTEAWGEAASTVLAARDKAKATALVERWQKAQPTAPKKAKKAGASKALSAKMDRVDDEAMSDAERSRVLREVFEETESIADTAERLMFEGAITAWFAEKGEEGTAALAATKLHKTFAETCRCEDGQCDSIAGRAECSENIDMFAAYLAEKKIDPAVLRIRHPSLAARALVVKLKEALQ